MPAWVFIALALAGACLGAWELLVTRLCSALFFWDLAYLALSLCIGAIAAGALLGNRLNLVPQLGMPAVVRWSLTVPLAAAGAWVLLVRYNWAWGIGAFTWPFVCFGAASALAFARARDGREQSRLYFAEVAGVLLGLVVVGPWLVSLAPVPVLGKVGVQTHLRQLVAREGLVSLRAHSTAAARTDLLQTRRGAVRYVLTDGMFTARSVRWDGKSATFGDPYVEQLAALKRLSHRLSPSGDVLLLGAGAGFDAAIALQEGAKTVTAVEVNAATVSFAGELDAWAGGVLANPRVRSVVGEGRRFVAKNPARYSLISLALVQTAPASGRGRTHVHAHIVTVEAIEAYIAQLQPGGCLAVIQNTAPLADATEVTVRTAAQRTTEPLHVARWELRQPDLPDGARNPFAHLITVHVGVRQGGVARNQRAAAAALGAELVARKTAHNGSNDTVRAATDDRPFLFVAERQTPLHVPIAIAAALLGFAMLTRRLRRRGQDIRWPLVGFLAGAAAMGLQVLAVQCGQLALGDPVQAWSWSLAAVLGGSALGAVLLGPRLANDAVIAALACAGVLVVLATRTWLLGDFDGSGAALVWVAVGAMPAGLPFLAAVNRSRADGLHEGVVIGADALGGVLGASLALLVALTFGFSALWWLLCGLFATTALVGRARSRV